MFDLVRKLFGGGGAAAVNVGVGFSFLCYLIGHAFRSWVPEWVLEWGCPKCGGEGKLPVRPEGGGRFSVAYCDLCGGSGIDPAKKDQVPEDWGQKKRRWDRHKADQPQGLVGIKEHPSYTDLIDDYAEYPGWMEASLDWYSTYHLKAEVRGWGGGPNTEHELPKRKGRVKIVRPSCKRCGAANPAFTEPPSNDTGIIGRILRWLF